MGFINHQFILPGHLFLWFYLLISATGAKSIPFHVDLPTIEPRFAQMVMFCVGIAYADALEELLARVAKMLGWGKNSKHGMIEHEH